MYLLQKDIMGQKRKYQLTYHPTQLNRKPETKFEKMEIYNNMVLTGTTVENVCNHIGNPEQIINRFNGLDIKPNFWYTSHSDSPEYRKFRICILLDELLTDRTIIGNIYSNIFYHFPADNSCKDAARIFYGGKKVYFLTEEANSLEILKFILKIYETRTNRSKKRDVIYNLTYNQSIKNLKY